MGLFIVYLQMLAREPANMNVIQTSELNILFSNMTGILILIILHCLSFKLCFSIEILKRIHSLTVLH